jgi:hypothetical protein
MPHSTQPLAPYHFVFTYLENQLLSSWWLIPIHSCPWSANKCPTLCWLSHPFTPRRSSYNIYIEHINNTSRPRLAHLPLVFTYVLHSNLSPNFHRNILPVLLKNDWYRKASRWEGYDYPALHKEDDFFPFSRLTWNQRICRPRRPGSKREGLQRAHGDWCDGI